MLRVNGLSHIQINVSNMERSLRFYRDGLGLVERLRTGPYILLSPPESTDFVSLSESAPVGAPGLGHFGLQVEGGDVEAAIQAVEKEGGKLLSRGQYPNFPSARVADPDGYVIEIHSRPALPVDRR